MLLPPLFTRRQLSEFTKKGEDLKVGQPSGLVSRRRSRVSGPTRRESRALAPSRTSLVSGPTRRESRMSAASRTSAGSVGGASTWNSRTLEVRDEPQPTKEFVNALEVAVARRATLVADPPAAKAVGGRSQDIGAGYPPPPPPLALAELRARCGLLPRGGNGAEGTRMSGVGFRPVAGVFPGVVCGSVFLFSPPFFFQALLHLRNRDAAAPGLFSRRDRRLLR